MNIYNRIKNIALFTSKYDDYKEDSEEILAWLESPWCPLTEEDEE